MPSKTVLLRGLKVLPALKPPLKHHHRRQGSAAQDQVSQWACLSIRDPFFQTRPEILQPLHPFRECLPSLDCRELKCLRVPNGVFQIPHLGLQ